MFAKLLKDIINILFCKMSRIAFKTLPLTNYNTASACLVYLGFKLTLMITYVVLVLGKHTLLVNVKYCFHVLYKTHKWSAKFHRYNVFLLPFRCLNNVQLQLMLQNHRTSTFSMHRLIQAIPLLPFDWINVHSILTETQANKYLFYQAFKQFDQHYLQNVHVNCILKVQIVCDMCDVYDFRPF